MENNEINSCLMLTVNLKLPVSLKYIFDDTDLKDTGIELDSHITILYAQGKTIPRENLISDMAEILGPEKMKTLMEMNQTLVDVELFDMFELGNFENDSDYVVLKLKKSTALFEILELVNKGLRDKYGITSEFTDYTPHISLAELQVGTSEKYLNSEKLRLVLEKTLFDVEDFMISYGTSNEVEDRKQYFLTQNKCIDRYFRLQHLKEE